MPSRRETMKSIGSNVTLLLPVWLVSDSITLSYASPVSQGVPANEGFHPISHSSFGLHVVGVTGWDQPGGRNTVLDTMGCGSVRIWDTGATWRILNPSPGVYNWAPLDREMAKWTPAFQDVLYCLGQAPDWAATGAGRGTYNPNPLRTPSLMMGFISALLQRYPQITGLELWNEPNFPQYYNGDVVALAQLTAQVATEVKAMRPGVKVISAGIQPFADRGSYLTRYIQALRAQPGADNVAAISIHTYVQPRQPEAMIGLIYQMAQIVKSAGFHKPMWSTEFGWGKYVPFGATAVVEKQQMSDDQALSYLIRGYLVSLGMGIERQFFYAVDKSFSNLVLQSGDDHAQRTRASRALAFLVSLIAGGSLKPPIPHGAMFVQPMISANGTFGKIFWTVDDRKVVIALTGRSRVLDSVGGPINSGARLTIGSCPVYVLASGPNDEVPWTLVPNA